MEDFLKEVVGEARKTANKFFDALDELTDDKKGSKESRARDYDELVDQMASLEDEVDALSEELAEAHLAIKLLLDGEFEKVVSVSDVQHESLHDYIVETYWQGDSETGNQLVIRQRRV